MASSLEELLAEEGFRRRRSGMTSRASFRADAVIKSLHHSRDKSKTDSPLGHRIKTERTRSDVARYILRGELPRSDSSSSGRPRDNLVSRQKIDGKLKIESWERPGNREPNCLLNNQKLKTGEIEEIEVTDIGAEEDEEIKDIYSDKAYNSERSEKSTQANGENHRYIERKGNNILVDERQSSNWKSIRLPNPSYDSSVRSSKSVKNFKCDEGPKLENVSQAVSELAIDEVAVKAMVSILCTYINHFFKDEEFRIMLRHNCFSSLNFVENGEGDNFKIKAITNLEQAIEIVEQAAEQAASTKDLKRAFLQLRVLKSLNSNELKDGHTSGIPNSMLSACAHLYLSVIYKLQKKDRASAKYLLQVFCDSPFSARTLLLPELWDYLFYPQLSHLKEWYNQEAHYLLNTPSRIRKIKLLDKVYNEILDSGTYQFAVYYKDWLTEGVQAPSLPSIHIPAMSVQDVEQTDSNDHFSGPSRASDLFSPQPMVSKKLYEAVFSHSSKPGSYEAEDMGEADNCATSGGSVSEVQQTIMHSSEIVKYVDQDGKNNSCKDEQYNTFQCDNSLISASKEEWKLVKVSASTESDISNRISNSNGQQEPANDGHMLNASSHTQENESILMGLAKSVFELQQNVDSSDIKASTLSNYCEPIKVMASYEELDGAYEYFDKGSLASVPQDFICPLSGQLLEEPVTLETGQTFEKEAIREWFIKGNRKCPVTGKTLECLTVPFTNFVLKRVIDSWKLEYCSC